MGEVGAVDKAKDSFGKVAKGIGAFTREKSTQVTEKGADVVSSTKQLASETVERLKPTDPDVYDVAVAEYNSAFTAMNDQGLTLLRQRERSVDLISLVENLVNSIAHTPKSFATDISEISHNRSEFTEAEEFARNELKVARQSATGAGAGIAAGAAVASLAPSAALWVATTFGTASTGTAISALSGAAASSAAMAWLGGGALAVGGGGTAAGTALIALAGPIGWTLAGATLLTSIVLFNKQKSKIRADKDAALTAIKNATAAVKIWEAEISVCLSETESLRTALTQSYGKALPFFEADFRVLAEEHQAQLAALVNNTKSCAALLNRRITQGDDGA